MIMVDYREILRLLSLKYNYTQIAEALHSSRNTIREVGKLADLLSRNSLINGSMNCFIRNDWKKCMYIWSQTAPTSIRSWLKKV